MDESNREQPRAAAFELRDMLLASEPRSLAGRIIAEIQAGRIMPETRFGIDIDLRTMNSAEVVKIVRDIKTVVENMQLRDKIDHIRVVMKKSQYTGEVVNAVSPFRSQCEILE